MLLSLNQDIVDWNAKEQEHIVPLVPGGFNMPTMPMCHNPSSFPVIIYHYLPNQSRQGGILSC